MFDNLHVGSAPQTVVVEFNGKRELRLVSHVERTPGGLPRIIPQTRDDEDIVWFADSDIPRIVHR